MKFVALLLSPLVFGIGFFAPLISQMLTYFQVAIFGIDSIYIGLAVAICLGLMAHVRGSWLWIRP